MADNNEEIMALWAAVNQLKATAEDGVSMEQIRDELAQLQVHARGNIRAMAKWPEVFIESKISFDDPSTRAVETSGYDGPFALSVSAEGWAVSSRFSTVTDGTNGPAADLSTAGFDSPTAISATKLVILWATINPTTLVATDWELAAVDAADALEAKIDITPAQTEVRLVIGKIVFTSGSPTVYQFVRDAQLLTHGLLNGLAVRVFESAPVHIDHVPA